MSDFSAGILMQGTCTETAKAHIEDGTHLIRLNDRWLCRLSENDFSGMAVENYSEAVLELSSHIPLLHAISAEDHGFELGILHHKQLVFHVKVAYDMEGNFAFDVGKELYGDQFMTLFMDPAVQEKVHSEARKRCHEVNEIISSFFTELTAEAIAQFELFGFDRDACAKIGDILTAENYQKDGIGYQMMEELFTLLQLTEFSFVSHRYVESEPSIFNVVQ